jgi:RNA recognition motif-containing protein
MVVLKLFVANLPYEWEESELASFFEVDAANVSVQRNKAGYSRGYGFVTTENHEEYTRCLALNETKLLIGGEKPFILILRVRAFNAEKKNGVADENNSKEFQCDACGKIDKKGSLTDHGFKCFGCCLKYNYLQ